MCTTEKNYGYTNGLLTMRVPQEFGEQGSTNLFLGNRRKKLYKLEDENIFI